MSGKPQAIKYFYKVNRLACSIPQVYNVINSYNIIVLAKTTITCDHLVDKDE